MSRHFKVGDKRALVIMGPLALLRVGPRAVAEPYLKRRGFPARVDVTLMVDTGAFRTFVEESRLQTLGLKPSGTAQVITASQQLEVLPVYPARVELLDDDTYGHRRWDGLDLNVIGAPARLAGVEYDGLLGRDFLAACRLEYEGLKGDFTITFFGDYG